MKNGTRCFLALVAAGFGTQAWAAGITLQFNGVWGQGVSYTTNSGGNWQGTTAGRFSWTVLAPGGGGWNTNDQLFTFCSELTEFVGTDVKYAFADIADIPTSGLNSPMGTLRAELLAELFRDHFDTAITGNAGTDVTEAAAMQIAVWEIVNEANLGSLSVNAGTFQIQQTGDTSAARGLANTWLTALGLTGIDTGDMVGFSSNGAQDQMTMIPLPPPIWLAGVGLLGLVVGRKRLQRAVVS